MLDLSQFYRRSPLFLQNLMATGYGMKERLIRYGGKYQRFVDNLTESQWWPRERLQGFQNERLRELIEFCYAEVPYYQDLFRSLRAKAKDIQCPADLTYLPILEKETVRAQPERFIPQRIRERLISQTTGGTTGKPLRYFVTPTAIQYNYAAYEVRFRNWAGVKFGNRMASINGRPIVPIDTKKPPFWRYNLAFNQIYLSAYHLSAENLPYYIHCLQKFKPKVIVGYVSTVHSLAKFILERKSMGFIQPKAVLVSSETLFDWIRNEIETAFNCKVFNGYSLGELVAFISECEAGSLHISPEYGIVEMEEIGGNLELICTGLFNYGMPLLRYRTGDIVEQAEQQVCACGRQLPMVKAILGRVDDCVVTPEGSIVGPAPLSLAFQSVPNLRDAQIYQENPAEIIIYISVTRAFSKSNGEFLLEELRNRLGNTIRINLAQVDEIPRTVSGKQRLIVSKLKPTVGSLGVNATVSGD